MSDEVLFYEQGASWRWLLLARSRRWPCCSSNTAAGIGFQPIVPLFFLVLLSGVLFVQVKAARIHTSVELTADSLREGTEVLPLSGDRPGSSGNPDRAEIRQGAACLAGGPTPRRTEGVPKGRTAIGLKLSNAPRRPGRAMTTTCARH